MKYLFLDDERIPGDVTWVKIPAAQWEIVRSFRDAVDWVNKNGFPDVISFDHDLGYEKFEVNDSGILVVTDSTESPSGYDFAKWLVNHDIENNSMPKSFSFTVHSMNPVGAENIRQLLTNYIRLK